MALRQDDGSGLATSGKPPHREVQAQINRRIDDEAQRNAPGDGNGR